MNPGAARLLRLYVNADDRFEGKPLYEALILKARAMSLAGASVFAAELGYGCHRVVHDAMSEYTFSAAPLIVEIIDSAERIQDLLAECKAMAEHGLVTLSPVAVVRYVHSSQPQRSAADAD